MTKIFLSLLCYVLLVLMFPFSALGEEGGIIVVRDIVGKGASRHAALVDAFRNAISQALGTYVVTSRTWDGGTLDKKIYDNSDAVVNKHWVVDEREADGKWSVSIDAEIVRNEMIKYVRKETTTKVEEGELANLLAKRKAIDNAVNSLELLFQNWRENVYRAEKYGKMSIAADDNAGGDSVQVSVPFIITFRWGVYSVFLDKVRNVLSRIALGKGNGVSDDADCWDFGRKNASLYNSLGLKDDGGRRLDNANGYGEIRIVSRLPDSKFRYEIYIVPNQVKQALDRLLTRKVDIKFSFTSKGGETVVNQIISGKVYSFGWNYLGAYGAYGPFELSDYHPLDSGYDLVGIMDEIETSFLEYWYDDRKSACCRLYHVTIQIPLSAVSRIESCTITVCPPGGKGNWVKVTSEEVSNDEWMKIDRKPMLSDRMTKILSKSGDETQSASESVAANDAVEAKPIPLMRSSISEKEKKLKARVLGLCQLSPDISSAKKWFALTRDMESFELNQAVFKVVGSALVYDKKMDVYQSKIRKRIKDVSIFEDSLYIQCPDCEGVKTTEKKCSACAGNGVCKYANCRGGACLVRGFKGLGGDHYERCRKCFGSGACRDCNGKGTVRVKCFRCFGKGRVFCVDSAAKIYHQLIEQISNAYQ